MKKRIPAQTLEVCDFCHSDGYLQECWVCSRQFCLVHQGTVAGSYGFTRLCPECSSRDDVKAICDKWAKKLQRLFGQRDGELQALPDHRRPAT